MTDTAPDLQLDPDKGAYVASFGPKGTGKSELNRRLFMSYPYDGLLIDHTGDVDPEHHFTEPLPPALLAIARRLRVEKDAEPPSPDAFKEEIDAAWRDPEAPGRRRKFRYVPNTLADDWLERQDLVVGLAYIHGLTDIFHDEVNHDAPAGQTPRWTRTCLHMGRHRQLSEGMAGPRPSGIDPLVVSQADVVTIHGPLHERDVARLAAQFHMSTAELVRLISELEIFGYLAFFPAAREIQVRPALPPPSRNVSQLPASA
jgi:hypothetical protein